MLVLIRKIDQAIIINGNIRVTICGVGHQNGIPRVKVGIEAPPEINIAREELLRCDNCSGCQEDKAVYGTSQHQCGPCRGS